MSKKLKVYGGNFYRAGKQVRGIIAGTKKTIHQLTHKSMYSIDNHWTETGNAHELEIARSKPGTMFFSEDHIAFRELKT